MELVASGLSSAGLHRSVPATPCPQASMRSRVWDPHILVCDGVLTHFLSVSQALAMSPGELVFSFNSMSLCPAPVPQGPAGGSCSTFDLLSEQRQHLVLAFAGFLCGGVT